MTEPAPADVVESFLFAVMRDKDFDLVETLVADDLVYENVGYSTMRGGDRIVGTFRRMSARVPAVNWDVEFRRVATDGNSVLTERIDSMLVGRFRADFWVCGRFDVREGKVTLWRDYFDAFDVMKGMVRGLAAMAVPSLRRTRPQLNRSA